MTRVFAQPAPSTSATSFLTLAATRCWRRARDTGRPVHTALYEALDAYRVGALAPVFASLISLYETCSGRPILVGGSGSAGLSTDEHHLLGLLDGSRSNAAMLGAAAGTGLFRAMRIAVHSTRIMMRAALESAADIPPLRSDHAARAGGDAPVRRARVAAYRNKSLAALVDILRGAYRVTARILGEAGFDAAALAFARRHPPADPAPIGYGRGFADFLAEQLPPFAHAPYLADVATLERLWTEAELADDAPALELADLTHEDKAVWTIRRLPLHPATRFIWLSTPAVTVWQAHQDGLEAIAPERRPEGALVTRRTNRVGLQPIDRPEHRMLYGLRLGEGVREAAAAAAILYPQADTAAVFAKLVGSGAFARSSFEPLRG